MAGGSRLPRHPKRGWLAGTPVITGTTDAAAEAISAGIAELGDMMVMLGSSVFFIMKSENLVPSQRFWSSNFLEKAPTRLLEGCRPAAV